MMFQKGCKFQVSGRTLFPELLIALSLTTLVLARYVWISLDKPSHWHEIARAYGSVICLYGTPQPDSTGQRVAYVSTDDKGYAVFLAKTSSGKAINVCEERALGPWGHDYDLHVWPWPPDDSAFVYSRAGKIVFGDPETGKDMAVVSEPMALSSLVWLNKNKFVCLGVNDSFYQFEKQADGSWELCRNLVASSSDSGSDVTKNSGLDWSASNDPHPRQIHFKDAAQAASEYAVLGVKEDAPAAWELLASDDGVKWSLLDCRTNKMVASRPENTRYALTNQTPFQYYRLKIAEGMPAKVQFQLWAADTPDTASASTENAPKESAAKAFNDEPASKWYNNNRPKPWWLRYQFGGGKAWPVSQYTLVSGNDCPERDPKDWELQASNDSTNWVVLDTRQREVFDSRQQAKTYQITNTTAYRIYQLHVLQVADEVNSNLQLSSFILLAPDHGKLTNVALLKNPFTEAHSLTALSEDTVAWVGNNRACAMKLRPNQVQTLADLNSSPATTALNSLSFSKPTGQLLLDCEQASQGRLYQLDPKNTHSLQPLSTALSISNAAWFGGAKTPGWIGQKDSSLLVHQGLSPKSETLLSNVTVTAFNVTADGKQLFMFAAVSNEPAPGIWQLDLESIQLRNIIPCGKHQSKYAKAIQPIDDFILSDCGKFTVYLPKDYYSHPDRKYPLVIGDTDFGMVVGGGHGRLWLPSMAACNAYVLVVNRKSWTEGLDHWGEDVLAAYKHLVSLVPVDESRVFLFASSAETAYLSKFLTDSPVPWRGAILLNPSGLPDLAGLSQLRDKPKILISVGDLEDLTATIKEYQKDALKLGITVDLSISAGEKHHFVGTAAQIQRTTDIARFVFDE